ncbi:gallinacin-13-like [Chelonia mydas]|uniref:gallinacin-13-like n=1 Tax=Chelonia mydas TaxID=8469 RepID=UPI0018A2205F|nr:gallinacin-13-like [Chelonia mydas]
MRILYLFFAVVIFFLQAAPTRGSAYDTLQCLSNHGHCRPLCFHMERQVGTCTNGHQRCCK